ncbi:MAG: winged helix-turn-helix domain-containing protein [Methanomassiliicoccales archaeon]
MNQGVESSKYKPNPIIPRDNQRFTDGGIHRADLLRTSQLLTDEYSVKILVATIRVPKSAQDISEAFNIPIAACYRRIRDLEKEGLLVCTERRLSRQGKRVSYYLSMLKSAYVFFDNGHLRVKFELKTGGADQFGTDWHEIPLEGNEKEKRRSKESEEEFDELDKDDGV